VEGGVLEVVLLEMAVERCKGCAVPVAVIDVKVDDDDNDDDDDETVDVEMKLLCM
jgi:hypothetical protein